MGTLKDRIGTRLQETGLLQEARLRKLQALSITTVEELLGLISADPSATGQFLEISNLAALQADAAPHASMAIMGEQDRQKQFRYAFGANPPAEVTVEDRVSPDSFSRYFEELELGFVAGQPGTETDLRNCHGPVRDQGRERHTCVAFAGCALMECLYHSATKSHIDYSEQFLYWNAKQKDGIPNQPGTYLEVAIPTTASDGICLESVWPYNPIPIPGNESQDPPPKNAISEARKHKSSGYQKLDPRSPRQIRKTIDNGYPVAISVPVYNDWADNPSTRTHGLIPMPQPLSVLVGGHAMCATSYRFDDEFPGGGAFILRNSSGSGWAPLSPIEPGYAVIPFSYIDQYGWEAYFCY